MNILWAGGEDLDFALLGSLTSNTNTSNFRTSWARLALAITSGSARATSFPGGPVTTVWTSFRINIGGGVNSNGNTNALLAGLSSSSTGKSLYLGIDGSNYSRLALFKYDGNTKTWLASEPGASIVAGTLQRIDLQVSNFGTSATVTVYVGGTAVLTYTGDVTSAGFTNVDSLVVGPGSGGSYAYPVYFSEIFCADSDTRGIQGLQTLAPNALGTTDQWTNGAVATVAPTSYNDTNPAYTNATAQDQQYRVPAPVPSQYSVAAIVISARMAKSGNSTPSQVKLGYSNGTTSAFGTGAAKTPQLGFAQSLQIDQINPITGAAFTPTDMASIQLDLQSV